MSKIKAISIDKKNLALQILSAVLILSACFTSNILLIVVAAISLGYLFSNAEWEQKFAFFLFMLAFSPIFKFESGQTSFFIFLRMAIVLSYLFQRKEKFSFTFITLLIAFAAYCFILSELYGTEYLVHLINIALWIMIGYIMNSTLRNESSTPVVKSLANGTILTGVIGLFLNDLPQIAEKVELLSIIAQDGAQVFRYAGFWSDPNYFSVILITSLWTLYFEYNRKRINFTENIVRCALLSFLGLMTMSKSCVLMLAVFWIYVIIAKNNIKTSSKVSLVFIMIFAVIIFIWKNPYWISDIIYRFNAGGETATLNDITTGRTDIWSEYLSNMLDDFSWIYGHGINPKLYEISGYLKGSHNTLIQMFFNFGVFGTLIYVSIFASVYRNGNSKMRIANNQKKNPGKYVLLSLLISLLFLDGLYIESYYYMIAFSFIYLRGIKTDETMEQQ